MMPVSRPSKPPRMPLLILSVMVLSLAMVATAGAAPLNPDRHPAPGTRIWLGGYRLHLHCTGTGKPSVVLDAGLGGTVLDWQRVQPQIARFTRVCSYDRPGYGWSDRASRPHTVDWLIEELRRLLGGGSVAVPYVLVGHSFGGLIAQLYARRFPEQIGGLVLVDSTHPAQFGRFAEAGVDKPLAPPVNRQFVIGNHYRIPDGLPETLRATARALALMPDSVYSLYSEMQHLQYNAHLVQRIGGRLPDVPLVVLAHDSRMRVTDERRQRLAETWLGLQDELSREVSRGRLVITDRSGHYIQLDQPELVIDAVHDVVRQVRTVRP